MGKLAERLSFVNMGDVCSRCENNCCLRFYAVLLPDEENEFEGFSSEVQTPLGPVRTLGRPGRPCPFLTDDMRCSIYPRRPLDCRAWPVVVYYDFETGERVVYLDLDCDAVRNGTFPSDLLKKMIKAMMELPLEDEWLKRYTLAPWPNNFIEVARFRSSRLERAEVRARQA